MRHVQLSVCVRKRPLNAKEQRGQLLDCVTVCNPLIKVLTPKLRVDGITRFIEELAFAFDNTFGEDETTDALYESSVQSSLESVFLGGNLTVFAYG